MNGKITYFSIFRTAQYKNAYGVNKVFKVFFETAD